MKNLSTTAGPVNLFTLTQQDDGVSLQVEEINTRTKSPLLVITDNGHIIKVSGVSSIHGLPLDINQSIRILPFDHFKKNATKITGDINPKHQIQTAKDIQDLMRFEDIPPANIPGVNRPIKLHKRVTLKTMKARLKGKKHGKKK